MTARSWTSSRPRATGQPSGSPAAQAGPVPRPNLRRPPLGPMACRPSGCDIPRRAVPVSERLIRDFRSDLSPSSRSGMIVWFDAADPGTTVSGLAGRPRTVPHGQGSPRIPYMNRYNTEADDFYINVNLNTELELPSGRDTVLHYFEQMKKAFPELRNFYTRESGDLVSRATRRSSRIAGWRSSPAGSARATSIPSPSRPPIASTRWSWIRPRRCLTISALSGCYRSTSRCAKPRSQSPRRSASVGEP